MDDESLWVAQRRLRRHLLDRAGAIEWQLARDLAAHLLLHLEDPAACWHLAAGWLRNAFDADRVDCGFGRPGDPWYRPQAQALRLDRDVPSVLGHAFQANDVGVQAAWHARGAMVLRDVSQASLLSERERAALMVLGTRVKMAAPIISGLDRPLGLVCLDWLDPGDSAVALRGWRFEQIIQTVLGPVMSTAHELARDASPSPLETGPTDGLERLTPAEQTVVRLAADGLSYKEIARRLGRSFSTIDHQLRSARAKLGVTSTARLVNRVSGRARP